MLAANEGLATILWVVLLGGALITIAFTYLFGLEDTVVHTLMVAALAITSPPHCSLWLLWITPSRATCVSTLPPSSRCWRGFTRASLATSEV